ncbi:MAG TPA: 2-oxoglutarate dehydrogenase E1 component [Myxococcaceae bacterium]|nr:2-oxoglutarate dehydrogenase E1 component [Myxococcaceae bacterium]
MSNPTDTFLSGSNIDFIEGLYARWLEDPGSVDPSWQQLFAGTRTDGRPLLGSGDGRAQPTNGHGTGNGSAATAKPMNGNGATVATAPARIQAVSVGDVPAALAAMQLQARVDQTLYAFRLRGHLLAQLDPLGRPRPQMHHIADLAMASDGEFRPEELEQLVDSSEVFADRKRVKLRELLARLRRTYCGHLGVEYMTLLDSDRRRWLMPRMEHSENQLNPGPAEQRRILEKLTYADTFEAFIHTKYQGAKRFSVDGGESLLPMLDTMLELGGELGVEEVVIGMAHRGRLNVLTNVLGKSPDQIFSEFNGPVDPRAFMGRGDVKYHMGFSSDVTTSGGKRIHLSLAFNPSHLEFVHPVVEGRARAKQQRLEDQDRRKVLPLVIHGDAAMAGQGVVAETLNLSRLRGYDTGGTVHLVINNQLGYTTDPEDGRSSIYCTAVAQMLDIPIFHVNGDDPEACVHAMRLATEYRQRFQSDVVLDLVCFRRYGHNEGDEPSYTQPLMYEAIRHHPPVSEIYARALAGQGRVSTEEAEALREEAKRHFLQAYNQAKETPALREPSAHEGLWKGYRGGPEDGIPDPETGVPATSLAPLLEHLAHVPQGFTPLRQMGKILERRAAMARGEIPLDWSAGENLAYATLLKSGTHVRLTGQDTERGTFGHRNAVLHDVKTGISYVPLKDLGPGAAPFEIYNSPLSETGCMGFEFGYSLDYPDALVLWEAQFGDFANGAQVIIDQFIVAAEDKWRRLSGLTLLLPHGYEGAGPEHSSARLERFLAMSAEDNIQVCYPTSSAQVFHLLRRQAIRPWRKPLVVMTPKSLLRREEASAPLSAFTSGKFQRLVSDPPPGGEAKVTRLLLCTGKVAYDLLAARAKAADDTVAIARLEQLYPFPEAQLAREIARYPELEQLVWVQEEPENMGAWSFVLPRLSGRVSAKARRLPLRFAGREASASPATGFQKTHELEQVLLIDAALSRGQPDGR